VLDIAIGTLIRQQHWAFILNFKQKCSEDSHNPV
jgi:hypothetical protein